MADGPPSKASRRLAFLIAADAFLAFLGVGALTGFVAADHYGYPGIPRTFGVLAPRINDTFAYRSTLTLTEGSIDIVHAFRWLSPEVVLDAAGRRVLVNRLAEQNYLDLERPNTNLQVHLQEVGTQAFAGTRTHYETSRLEGNLVTGIRSRPRAEANTMVADVGDRPLGFGSIPCGALNPLQGASLDIHTQIPLVRECSFLLLEGYLETSQPFRPVASHLEPSGRVVVFVREFVGRTLNLWFREDVPYPVRVVAQAANGSISQAELVHFRAGQEPLPTSPRAREETLWGPGAPVARGPRGPEEGSVRLVFPFSQAFSRASQEGPLARFISDNAGAWGVEAAHYVEWSSDNQLHRKWWFSVVNGKERMLVGLVREEIKDPSPTPLLPPTAQVRYRYENTTEHDPRLVQFYPYRAIPNASDLAVALPTLEGMLNHWRGRLGDPAAQPNTWGFRVRLMGEGSPPDAAIVIGRLSVTERTEGTQVERVATWDTLEAQVLRNKIVMHHQVSPYEGTFESVPPPSDMPQASSASLIPARPPPSWVLPMGPFLLLPIVGALLGGAITYWRQGRRTVGNKP